MVLWKSDGTTAATVMGQDIRYIKYLLWTNMCNDGGDELFRCADGADGNGDANL